MSAICNRRFSKGRIAAATVALLSLPTVAFGWTQHADFETHIHGHEFYRVNVETKGCELKLRALFIAPEAAYKNEFPAKNFYCFHARLRAFRVVAPLLDAFPEAMRTV